MGRPHACQRIRGRVKWRWSLQLIAPSLFVYSYYLLFTLEAGVDTWAPLVVAMTLIGLCRVQPRVTGWWLCAVGAVGILVLLHVRPVGALSHDSAVHRRGLLWAALFTLVTFALSSATWGSPPGPRKEGEGDGADT